MDFPIIIRDILLEREKKEKHVMVYKNIHQEVKCKKLVFYMERPTNRATVSPFCSIFHGDISETHYCYALPPLAEKPSH